MQANKDPSLLAGGTPPALPEAGSPVPRIYNCTGCRYVDAHGLVCDVCLLKILDDHAGRRKPTLIAACFEGRGCITLLRGQCAALM